MSVTSTIKSSGGDYATLAAWETAKDGLSADTYIASCDAGFDMGSVSFSGWTSGSIITIEPATDAEHDGVFTAGPQIDYSSGNAIALGVNNVLNVTGLRITGSGTGQAFEMTQSGHSTDYTLESCIMVGGTTGSTHGASYGSSWNGFMQNCIVKSPTGVGIDFQPISASSPARLDVLNCTIDGDGGDTTYGIQAYGEDGTDHIINVVNTVSVGTGSLDFRRSAPAGNINENGGSNNATEDTTFALFGSSGSIGSQVIADLFEDAANDDYNIKDGSNLSEAGADLSGTFTTSINNVVRSAPYDIGAFGPAEEGGGGGGGAVDSILGITGIIQ
jgi:hypothetical protein